MSALNGSIGAPPPSETDTGNELPSGEKRKRTHDEENEAPRLQEHVAVKEVKVEHNEEKSNDFKEFLNDLLEVLQV